VSMSVATAAGNAGASAYEVFHCFAPAVAIFLHRGAFSYAKTPRAARRTRPCTSKKRREA
jgi:hypothetical protein